MRRDLGDFQTPIDLVRLVLRSLRRDSGAGAWVRALEPTCGAGSFIDGLLELDSPPGEVIGIELQARYLPALQALQDRSGGSHLLVRQQSIFDIDLRRLTWSSSGPLLVVGNPPWVTNSELGSLGSQNTPKKVNLKGLRGIDAITGSANFDIAEYIWLKLITELVHERATIALLCKTSVARSVLEFAYRKRAPITAAWIRLIDAKRWFGAAVDACWFCVDLGESTPCYDSPVYPDLSSAVPTSTIGFGGGRLVFDLARYHSVRFADGNSPVNWRQGVKHDAASVMELTHVGDRHQNRLGEDVDVEADHIYPLLKGTDLYRPTCGSPQRRVIVTQRALGEDTHHLSATAPRLWRYLQTHSGVFAARKSSIYAGHSPFSMFGIGDYSFAPFKAAVSGLAKTPAFRAIGPFRGRPVMFDDTCYFVPCSCAAEAALLVSLLKSPECTDLLAALLFTDAKRPITKRILQRLDIGAILDATSATALSARVADELAGLGQCQDLGGEQPPPNAMDLPQLLRSAAGYGYTRAAPVAPDQQLQFSFVSMLD